MHIVKAEPMKFINQKKISLKNLDNFDTIIGDLIDNSDLSITNAVFSIAGPKIGNTISMTNRSFCCQR